MEKPCTRVLRKFSGELTIIQYWAARPPPALRLRRPRRAPAGFACSVDAGSGVSVTSRRLLAVQFPRGPDGAEVLGLVQQGAQVAELGDVAHLVPRHQAAHLDQRHLAAPRVVDLAIPLRLAPAV